jgi:thymidylate synthase (FAD)
MRIITEPTIEVSARTQFSPSSTFIIPDDGDDAVKLGSFSAKVCYDSNGANGRPNVENQQAVLEHRHGSVLEHYHVSLYISGITRGLSLELNRHRSFAISQRSTRYTAEEDAAVVLDPYFATLYAKYGHCVNSPLEDDVLITPEFNLDEYNLLSSHLASLYSSIDDYQQNVEWLMKTNPNNLSGFTLRKWARGKARNLLPHSLETRGVWTNNLRGWRWFIESRSDAHAEPEIRRLADRVLHTLKSTTQLYFDDFTAHSIVDSIPVWVPTYHKV